MISVTSQSSYNTSSNLLYDQMNTVIYNLNDTSCPVDRSLHDDYTLFENAASFSIIAEDEKCDKCKTHYSIVTCCNCQIKTCAHEECSTMFPDKNGYISVCKTCETEILTKITPYKHKNENNYNPHYIKAIRDLEILKQAIEIIS